mmetsp:Transcript_21120/g.41166  ORF Transcript_21120/g.41166 Transcript_21120/m.41166 type:complete len:363 (-) Transcript_21120:794-1882(-)
MCVVRCMHCMRPMRSVRFSAPFALSEPYVHFYAARRCFALRCPRCLVCSAGRPTEGEHRVCRVVVGECEYDGVDVVVDRAQLFDLIVCHSKEGKHLRSEREESVGGELRREDGVLPSEVAEAVEHAIDALRRRGVDLERLVERFRESSRRGDGLLPRHRLILQLDLGQRAHAVEPVVAVVEKVLAGLEAEGVEGEQLVAVRSDLLDGGAHEVELGLGDEEVEVDARPTRLVGVEAGFRILHERLLEAVCNHRLEKTHGERACAAAARSCLDAVEIVEQRGDEVRVQHLALELVGHVGRRVGEGRLRDVNVEASDGEPHRRAVNVRVMVTHHPDVASRLETLNGPLRITALDLLDKLDPHFCT